MFLNLVLIIGPQYKDIKLFHKYDGGMPMKSKAVLKFTVLLVFANQVIFLFSYYYLWFRYYFSIVFKNRFFHLAVSLVYVA